MYGSPFPIFPFTKPDFRKKTQFSKREINTKTFLWFNFFLKCNKKMLDENVCKKVIFYVSSKAIKLFKTTLGLNILTLT